MDLRNSSWPDLPWKTRLYITFASLGLDIFRRWDLIRRLMLLLEPKAPPSAKPINGVASSDVIIDPSRNLWFRIYDVPSSATTALPLLIYFHGGGFVTNTANSKHFDGLCRILAGELQSIVASVNYRLAPDHRCPSQYNDGLDTLKFIDGINYAALPSNTDLKRCFLAGDSAGANIAHHVAVRSAEHEFEKLKIVGIVAMQPFFGGKERTESELRLARAPILNVERTDWMWKSFLPQGSDRDHEASNVFGGDISEVKFPATVVIVGGYDPLQDWQRRYCDWLRKCGKEVQLVVYPNAVHGFYIFQLPQLCYLLIADVRDFIRKQSAETCLVK